MCFKFCDVFFITSIMMVLIYQRELDQWRKENRSLQLELRHEESLTAQVIYHIYLHLDA